MNDQETRNPTLAAPLDEDGFEESFVFFPAAFFASGEHKKTLRPSKAQKGHQARAHGEGESCFGALGLESLRATRPPIRPVC